MSSPAETPRSALNSDERHAQGKRSRAMAFPRKRAVTACENCRVRKTKCDNRRPQCATCEKSGLNCSYDSRLDHSSFDPASLLILERLGDLSQKLDSLSSPVSQPRREHTEAAPARASPPPPQRLDLAGSDECLEVFSPYASTDCILTWPVFAGRWPADLLSREIYNRSFGSTQTGHNEEPRYPSRKVQKLAISEEDVPELIDRYLNYVYPKNPIFYTPRIRELARHVSEDGFGWDSSSCLVLLACALGAISAPFGPANEAGQLHGQKSSEEAAQRRQTAELYFIAARKRMGLLEPSLIASQCHMLAGIYYMYTLRQIQGYTAFNQAGSSLALYLKGQAALEMHHHLSRGSESPDKRLEQRLYWTVLKSECEMRTEIDLPQSDLCKIQYPYPFPSPPSPRSPAQTPLTLPTHTPTPPSAIGSSSHHPLTPSYQAIEEQSWFYYLSEIALRRIENRVLNTFYKDDHHSWTRSDLQDMMSAALVIEEQLEAWISSAPESIRYDNLASEQDLDELRYVTQGREYGIRAYLYRPFLYRAVHSAFPSDPSLNERFARLVNEALASCLSSNSGLCMTHRHHGTWYGLRAGTAKCLMLAAAHMKGLITWTKQSENGGVAIQNEYGQAIQNCIEKLQYWEAESPDVVRAREMLQELTASS